MGRCVLWLRCLCGRLWGRGCEFKPGSGSWHVLPRKSSPRGLEKYFLCPLSSPHTCQVQMGSLKQMNNVKAQGTKDVGLGVAFRGFSMSHQAPDSGLGFIRSPGSVSEDGLNAFYWFFFNVWATENIAALAFKKQEHLQACILVWGWSMRVAGKRRDIAAACGLVENGVLAQGTSVPPCVGSLFVHGFGRCCGSGGVSPGAAC